MHPLVAALDLERWLIETYHGGLLRDESRVLFERYEPRLLKWLDNEVVAIASVRAGN